MYKAISDQVLLSHHTLKLCTKLMYRNVKKLLKILYIALTCKVEGKTSPKVDRKFIVPTSTCSPFCFNFCNECNLTFSTSSSSTSSTSPL